jgi:CO/xanthine dehydrogenase FAD-binding subunit
VAVAAVLELHEEEDTIAAVRVALAGVADRVKLASPELLTDLIDSTLSGNNREDAADAIAARIAASLEPPTDVHASAEYRRRLARVLTARALRDAYARAAGVPA